MNSLFDNIAESYDKELKDSLAISGCNDITIFAEYKIKVMGSKLSKVPYTMLEFGCGTGRNSFFMQKEFPESQLYGCDVSEKSIEIAKKINSSVQYDIVMSPEELLDVYKKPFDCIFISNVFHHIPFNEHQIWLHALYKILANEGVIFIFEHNPYNPVTKHIFRNSEIDRGAFMLKPSYCYSLFKNAKFEKLKLKYTLFFLWRNVFFETIERMLFWLPLGAQYYIWGKKI